jgi:hypothetical protein
MSDLVIAFNKSLPLFLLFESERMQFGAVRAALEVRHSEFVKQELQHLLRDGSCSSDLTLISGKAELNIENIPDTAMVYSDVYGAQHLLRFLYVLPELLPWNKTLEEWTGTGKLESFVGLVATYLADNLELTPKLG